MNLREKIPFRKESEVSKAGYYSNRTKDDILCEMTASERVGVHRYTFPKVSDKIWFYLDLSYRDETLFEEVKLNEFNDDTASKGLDIQRTTILVDEFQMNINTISTPDSGLGFIGDYGSVGGDGGGGDGGE